HPDKQTFSDDIAPNLRFLQTAFSAVGAAQVAWAVRAPDDTYHGLDGVSVQRFCSSAELFLNVSGSCWLRDAYRGARRIAYLASDPGYTQAKLWAVEHGVATDDQLFSVNLIRQHDRFLTLAEHFGAADCRVPAFGLDWRTTRPPIVIEHWPY